MKRIRSKVLLGYGVALLIVVTATWLWIARMREPHLFVGKVDPETGYRCRFTHGFALTQTQRPNSGNSLLDYAVFTPPSGHLRQWLESHLFHQPVAATPQDSQIVLYSLAGIRIDRLNISHRNDIVEQHDIRLSGYPATLLHLDSWNGGKHTRGTELYVYGPDHTLFYYISGSAEGANYERVDKEMQAIIASFRLERVAPPANRFSR